MTTHIYIRGEKGGAGSGNWGHAGRPGLVGGSGGGGMVMGAGQPSGGNNSKANAYLDGATTASAGWAMATYEERSATKRTIVSELSQRSGVDEVVVSEVIEQWAKTANDADIQALSLQDAAAEELGLKLSAWQQENIDTVRQSILDLDPAYRELHTPITSRANERAIIRAMYDSTQEELAKAGYASGDTVLLYRGISYESDQGNRAGNNVNYNGNTIESWSVNRIVARNFATDQVDYDDYGEVVSMAVPVSSIIGTARTGFGCLAEGEFVIAGSVPGSKAHVWETVKPQAEMSVGEEASFWQDIGETDYWT